LIYLLGYKGLLLRVAASAIVSFLVVMLAAPKTIRFLLRRKLGDRPEFDHADLNQLTKHKSHTPTMGGILIVGAIFAATVLFADLVGFTRLAEQLSPPLMVRSLDLIFTAFDELASRHGLEKIKTIGDAYMAVAGLPSPRPDHAEAAARMALDMLVELARYNQAHETTLQMRIGMNTGPVVAGVIGRHKFTYDLWGDTVNTASRMESHGEPGTIQITEATAAKLADRFVLRRRGLVDIKGKGELTTFLLIGPRS